jgi:hypothetical protein
MFNLSKNLDYVEHAIDQHWLFCKENILILPAKNDMSGITIIPRDETQKITFGYAMTGVVKDGVVTSSIYKLYMDLDFVTGESFRRYLYLSSEQNSARREAEELLDGNFSVIAEYWDLQWSDDIEDGFDHYQTTYTTTYTYWTFSQ